MTPTTSEDGEPKQVDRASRNGVDTSTCTAVIAADGARCGAPAVASFLSRRTGETFHECAAHAYRPMPPKVPKPHAVIPPNRAREPFVIVRAGRVLAYAHSTGERVTRRAHRLGGAILLKNRRRDARCL
jgi:hypothetical protein